MAAARIGVGLASLTPIMKVVMPGRGHRLVRVHHCNNSLSPGRLACPTRKAVTFGRLKRGAWASTQGRAAPTAPPGRAKRHRGANRIQRRPPVVPSDMRVPRGTTAPRHRPTNPAVGRPVEQHRSADEGRARHDL